MKKTLFMAICLSFGMFHAQAQDLIIPKQGSPITAYNLDGSNTFYFYTLDENAESTIFRISKDSVLMVRKADGTVLSNENTATNVASNKKTYPIIKDEDIYGILIAEGNKVFIPTNSSLTYEKAGQEELKQLVEKWGYWIVVEDVEQAHFVLQFVTITSAPGRDMSLLLIRPRQYYRSQPFITTYSDTFNNKKGFYVTYIVSSESPDENRLAAYTMCDKLKNYIKDDPNISKRFKKVLDADKYK